MTNKNTVLFTLTVSMDTSGLLTVKTEGNPTYDLLNRALEEVCYQVDESPVTLDKTLQLDDDGDFYEILPDDDSVAELDAEDDPYADAQFGDAADESADDGASGAESNDVDGEEDDEAEPAASGEVANAIGD